MVRQSFAALRGDKAAGKDGRYHPQLKLSSPRSLKLELETLPGFAFLLLR
jgi:hypothetical protein